MVLDLARFVSRRRPPPLRLVGLLSLLLWQVACQECCNDHDCSVKNGGANELCVEGACVEGDAEVVDVEGCASDDECNGGVCVDGACAFAAPCLRLNRSFVARLNGGATLGTVTATSDGCEVTFAYDVEDRRNTASVDSIERNGGFTGSVGIDGGVWSSATRVGVLIVDNAPNVITFGTDNYACVDSADCEGQLFTSCVVGDDGTGVCGVGP